MLLYDKLEQGEMDMLQHPTKPIPELRLFHPFGQNTSYF